MDMTFRDFAKRLEEIEVESSRLKMTDLLVSLIKQTNEKEVVAAINLVLGRLAPAYESIEFNLAGKMIIRSVSRWLGLDEDKVEKEYKKIGDLGRVVEILGESKRHKKELDISEVYDRLLKMAIDAGSGSQERKVNSLIDLLGDVDGLSRRYVVRMVMGKLRLGFSDKTILDALSIISVGDKTSRKLIDGAFQIRPDVAKLTSVVKGDGVEALAKLGVEVGIPVIPALCQRLNSAEEIVEKMGEVGVERKFDGTRVQIHYQKLENSKKPSFAQELRKGKQKLKTFTRNLEENSAMFPELEKMSEYVNARSVVLDCEAMGFDRKTGKNLPFQLTIKRKRKHSISQTADEIPLRFYVFDILEKDGETLIDKSYRERREILKKTIVGNDVLVVSQMKQTNDPMELHGEHEKYLREGFEGAVIKQISGKYLPGRQGWNWVKIKESEGSSGKLSDTLDCVVMGYYKGKGKRASFGIGAFLVGVVDGEDILTIAKIGTGITEAQLGELKRRLDKNKVPVMPKRYKVDKMLAPDVWVEPRLVVEIAADELTKSPIHTAKLALRFPRLIRIREDKGLEGVTAVSELGEF